MYWQASVSSAFSSPDWTAPAASAFLHKRDVSSLWLFLRPGSVLTPACLSCAKNPRTRCSTQSEVSQEQADGKITLPDLLAMFLLVQPRTHPDSIPIFLLDYMPLVPLPVNFLLALYLDQEVLTDTCWLWKKIALGNKSLKNCQLCPDPLSLSFPGSVIH